jgi:hypothetical protein
VVRAAVASLDAGRWADVIAWVRPEAVQQFRDTQLRHLLDAEVRAPRTPAQVQAEQPWIPLEVAAFYADEEQTHATRGLPALRAEWGVDSSFAELEALTPAEFFTRFLAASSPAARLRGALAISRKPPRDYDRALAAASESRRHLVVLGDVREGSRLAHVLYRDLLGGGTYDPDAEQGFPRVTTLDLVEGRWWLRIDHTLLHSQGWTYAWAPDDDESSA